MKTVTMINTLMENDNLFAHWPVHLLALTLAYIKQCVAHILVSSSARVYINLLKSALQLWHHQHGMNSFIYLLPVVWTVYPGWSWITLQSETMEILCQVPFSEEGIAAAVVVSWSTPWKYLRLMKLDSKVPTDTHCFSSADSSITLVMVQNCFMCFFCVRYLSIL